MAQARCELAAELLAGIRHLDAQRREARKKLAAAVTASGTSLTEVSGVGPVIAAAVIGDVITVARFPSRDHFAACNGTAPAGVSSGQRKIYRLSLRGNRRLSHAVHMAAINWIRHKHSDGRACCQRKLAEGKTRKEALRCLRRRISDAIYARLRADARKAGPGGQPGNDTGSRVTGSHPRAPALRTSHFRARAQPACPGSVHAGPLSVGTRAVSEENPASHLTTPTTKRIRSVRSAAGRIDPPVAPRSFRSGRASVQAPCRLFRSDGRVRISGQLTMPAW